MTRIQLCLGFFDPAVFYQHMQLELRGSNSAFHFSRFCISCQTSSTYHFQNGRRWHQNIFSWGSSQTQNRLGTRQECLDGHPRQSLWREQIPWRGKANVAKVKVNVVIDISSSASWRRGDFDRKFRRGLNRKFRRCRTFHRCQRNDERILYWWTSGSTLVALAVSCFLIRMDHAWNFD